MKMNPEDPRLTAYALDELGPGERAAAEIQLVNNPECLHAVEEIRRAAGMLSQELAAEPCPALSPEQRKKIEAGLEPENVVEIPHWRWQATAGLAALAACVMFVIAWQLWFAGPDKGRQLTASTQVKTQPEVAPVVVITPSPGKGSAETPVTPSSPETKPATPAISMNETETITNTGVLTVSAPPAEPAKANSPIIMTAQTATQTPLVDVAPAATATAELKPAPATATWAFIGNNSLNGPVQNLGAVDASKNAAETRVGGATAPAVGVSVNTTQSAGIHKQSVDYSQGQPSQQTFDNAMTQPGFSAGQGGGGGRGGRGSGGGGSGVGIAGGQNLTLARNSVVVTESEYRRTVTYEDDPARKVFGQWRYYRYPSPPSLPPGDTASYPYYPENSFQVVMEHPLSTFSVDVDTASYANVRRFLNAGRLPPKDAVRIEELVNYFTYNYPKPKGNDPFAATIEVSGCPWEPAHRLVRMGIKGREIASNKRPPSNFVFLIDISGSMQPRERLPLIKEALRQLVKKMGEGDRVAIVVYASEAGVRLASTSCLEKEKILEAIDSLAAGGSTNGGDGIQQAYRVAQENFIQGGVNRVLLCTDGDFNVGITDPEELTRMVQERAKSGVFLTTLGVGTDNYKDALMQKLADKGNGNYHYLDSLEEAQKVLIEQMSGTLVTVAKDVKVQIEFNPARVGAYRLIGYEKRALRNQDFNNDAKDAGEIGAGHTVTALYEIAPPGGEFPGVASGLKYQGGADAAPSAERILGRNSQELLTLKLRYKHPEGNESRLLEFPVTDNGAGFSRASADFKFAAAVASFGMLLRDSEHKGSASYATVLELAQEAKGADESGYRSEFINLVKKAQVLSPNR